MAFTLIQTFLFSVIGMPKEKYDPPDPRRMYTIMSSEEAANGKKSYWAELEISGQCCFYTWCLVLLCVCVCGNYLVLRQRLANTFYCSWSPTILWSWHSTNWPIFRPRSSRRFCVRLSSSHQLRCFFVFSGESLLENNLLFPTSLLLHFLGSVFRYPCFTSTHSWSGSMGFPCTSLYLNWSHLKLLFAWCCFFFRCLTTGRVKSLSTALWSLTHLTALHLSDNSLSRIPPDIAKLHNLVYLDLSSNKIRSLPAELGNMVSLRWVT